MGAVGQVDPVVAAVVEANRGRKPAMRRLKFRRMAADPFTFFRGAIALYARMWPDVGPRDPGPAILICGDLHLENFGAHRTETGDFRYDINDFDEAIVASCGLDLTRCAASILLAAERWGLTPTRATGMALGFLDAYRAALEEAEAEGDVGEFTPESGHGPIRHMLGRVAVASQAELLARHTRTRKDGRRAIRRTERTPRASCEAARRVADAIEATGPVRVLDVRRRIAGVGSLGLRRFVALVAGGAAEPRLLDVKEVVASALRGVAPESQPDWGGDEAHRVVAAQGALQGHPAAGLGTLAIAGRPYRVREMIPAENRAGLDRLRRRPERLRSAVADAGRLTARSHARGARFGPPGCDASALASWASGPASDAILAAACRVADRTNAEFAVFRSAWRAGLLEPE